MSVPAFDLTRQYRELELELKEAVERVMASGMYILGKEVQLLENEMAAYLGVEHCIGVANGTDAIWLSLKALEIEGDDVIITTPFTFFATAGAILNLGARPVFADVQVSTLNVDPDSIRDLLERNRDVRKSAKAIMPVHLYGQPADMREIMEIAEEFDLHVIEDNAQGIGAKYNSAMTGSLGDIGTISFFPTQNVGAFGDAGLVTTNDAELAERVRMLRVQGSRSKYYHEILGANSRLDALQAAILRVKLPHLNRWIARRQEHAAAYDSSLSVLDGIETLERMPERTHIYHQYTVRVLNEFRDTLHEALNRKGIGTSIHYPTPLHLQPALRSLGFSEGDFPIAERAAKEVLSLPIFPEMTSEERNLVINEIKQMCVDIN